MVFSSVIFLFAFLPLALAGYFFLPGLRLRNAWLIAVSLVFYAWGEPRLVVVMLTSIAINYAIGLAISARRGCRGARGLTVLGVAANLSLLGYYKYAGFLTENVNYLAAALGWHGVNPISVALPLGISFYIFQGISYLVDVYRGDAVAARNPLHLMLYISMFPHQLAGPIVRYRDIAEQIATRRATLEGVREGIMRFTGGLAKKVLLANVVAGVADAVFAQPVGELTFAVVWLGVICYTLQIYLDFSAYSDMAIGLAAMFGITFAENFNYPYISQSVTEFWRRWHMTLSNWFRDYVYIPLGGNRHGRLRTYVNLSSVFVLCGLWHGASWTFMAWGAYHGLFLVVERMGLGRGLQRAAAPIRHMYTLLTVMVGWVLFRADTLTQAKSVLGVMFGFKSSCVHSAYPLGIYLDNTLIAILVVAIAVCIPWRLPAFAWRPRRLLWPGAETISIAFTGSFRMAFMLLAFVTCGSRLVGGSHNPFIYFRF